MKSVMWTGLVLMILVSFPLLIGRNAKDTGAADQTGKVRLFNALTGVVEEVDRVVKTDEEWRQILTPDQFKILRRKGTERPFTDSCEPARGVGLYKCAGCGTDLFGVSSKFESGAGWPSFWTPVCDLNIRTERDTSLGMDRMEVLCARCGGHLGHVFDDGPPPTNKRYCINGAALRFAPAPEGVKMTEKATFAAGCFWGIEEAFRKLPGVLATRVGYTGGATKNPTYKQVCSDTTGHAEAVEVTFDPSKTSYAALLDVFWKIHDPTTLNRQGPDVGSQYRSAVFCHDKAQADAARTSMERLERSGAYKNKIVTQILPAAEFYPAEEYHQRYYQKRGGDSCRY